MLLLCSLGNAQQQTVPSKLQVQVGPNIEIASEAKGNSVLEPWIVAHPSNPLKLYAVAMIMNTKREVQVPNNIVYLHSNDGGKTWNKSYLQCNGCVDPWVTVTEKGAVLTVLGGTHPNVPVKSASGDLFAFFSPDIGLSWYPTPQNLGPGFDGPRSVADSSGTIYITAHRSSPNYAGKQRFSIFLGKVSPGEMYVKPMQDIVPSNLNVASEGLTTLTDGTLIFTLFDFQRPLPGTLFRSRAGALKHPRVWAHNSKNKGETVSVPLIVCESCFTRNTQLDTDKTNSTFRNRIYAICPGDSLKSIIITYSNNGGEEWSEPRAIELPSIKSYSRYAPNVSVNKEGIVAVSWMDFRDDQSKKCYTPYIAFSSDGGETFTAPVRVAADKSCPNTEITGFAASRWPYGGDYFGLTATADGRFHVCWADARSGEYKLMTAAVTVTSGK